MKRISVLAIAGLFWLVVSAQPKGLQPGSTYEMVSDMHRAGNDNPNMKVHKPEDIEKMEKKRAKEESKLVKSMQKLFKKDPAIFARWKTIRERQLKQIMPLPMK